MMEKPITHKAGKVHLGRNIARIRELKGMKQGTLAGMLGMSQQTVSRLEQKENMEEDKIKEIASALGVTPETIKNFNEDMAITIINNAFHDNSVNNGFGGNGCSGYNFQPAFNPVDRIIEQATKIEELYKELLKAERDKIEILIKYGRLSEDREREEK